jgi:hypothetical protein
MWETTSTYANHWFSFKISYLFPNLFLNFYYILCPLEDPIDWLCFIFWSLSSMCWWKTYLLFCDTWFHCENCGWFGLFVESLLFWDFIVSFVVRCSSMFVLNLYICFFYIIWKTYLFYHTFWPFLKNCCFFQIRSSLDLKRLMHAVFNMFCYVSCLIYFI